MLRFSGEMAERTKAPVSKTGIPPGIVGSNPTLSARNGFKIWLDFGASRYVMSLEQVAKSYEE